VSVEILGDASEIVRVRRCIDGLRRSASPVRPIFVTGETGTGKSLVARAIHEALHAGGRLIELRCTGEVELLESMLFARRGEARGADTLVIDDPLALADQQRLVELLLRVEASRSEVQVVALQSTPDALESPGVRPELRHRLNGVCFHLPPLRARGADVVAIARAMLARRSRELGLTRRLLSPEAAAALVAHSWPGNGHELANEIDAILLTVDSACVEPEHFRFLRSVGDETDQAVSLTAGDRRIVDELVAREQCSIDEVLRRALRQGLDSMVAGADAASLRLAGGAQRDALRARLTRVVRAGVSLKSIAQEAGVNPTALSRFRLVGTGIGAEGLGRVEQALDTVEPGALRKTLRSPQLVQSWDDEVQGFSRPSGEARDLPTSPGRRGREDVQ
jgi:DNA-binding NtrC family response regulator